MTSQPCLKRFGIGFGIDIVNRTNIHHKVAARVVCVFSEQDALFAAHADQRQNPHVQHGSQSQSSSPILHLSQLRRTSTIKRQNLFLVRPGWEYQCRWATSAAGASGPQGRAVDVRSRPWSRTNTRTNRQHCLTHFPQLYVATTLSSPPTHGLGPRSPSHHTLKRPPKRT